MKKKEGRKREKSERKGENKEKKCLNYFDWGDP